MRILQLITTLDPGGAENQLLVLCRELAREHEVAVAYLKGAGGLTPAFAALGIEVRDLGLRFVADPWMPGRIRSLIESFKPDVMNTHLFKADFYGAWAARARPTLRVISSKHNQDPELAKPVFGWLGRRALARADGVIAISDAVREFVLQHGRVDPGKLTRVYYGFDVAEFDARREEPRLRGDLGISERAPLALFLGRLTQQKGLDTLLEATALLRQRLPEVQVVLVGKGELEEELRVRCARLGLASTVHFAGFRSDVRGCLEDANLLVLPSRWEGFGMVLAEAMAAARAVVGSTAGSIPEVVAHGETGLLSSAGDAVQLAENLARLLSDPEQASNYGQAGRRRLQANFSISKMRAGTLAAYGDGPQLSS